MTPSASSTAPSAPNPSTAQLVAAWIRMWDGDLDAAPSLLADDITLHVARIDGVNDDRGPEALTSWIVAIRTVMPDLRFDIEVGPFVDGDVVVLRWIASGHYAGGWPGAASPAGTAVRFGGTDILRVSHSRVAEYWLNTDLHVLLAQLGVLAG